MSSGRALSAARLALAILLALSALGLFGAGGAKAQTSGWTLSPSSWDFGTRLPEEGPSAAKTFTLTNTGEEELEVNFVSVGGNDGAGFHLDENHCGGTLPSGGECEIAITFNPTSPGEKDGELQVATLSGSVDPASAKLSGKGAGPEMELSPAALDFGMLALGLQSEPRYFTLKSVGVLPLTISELSLEPTQTYDQPGAGPSQFALAEGSCRHEAMPPGSSCTIGVVFAPSAIGQLQSRLEVHSEDAPGLVESSIVEGSGVSASLMHSSALLPQLKIVHHPRKRTSSRRATFWLQGSSTTARFACRLDKHRFQPCESPVRYQRLRPGAHWFLTRAFDAAGRLEQIAGFSWRIERAKQ